MVTSSDIHKAYIAVIKDESSGRDLIKLLLVNSLSPGDRTAYEYLKKDEYVTSSELAGMWNIRSQNASRSLKRLVDLDLAKREIIDGRYRYIRS